MVSATNQMYTCLADLIKWSDGILINGFRGLNKESANKVVNNLKDSVNILVKLCIERYQSKEYLGKSPTCFNFSQPRNNIIECPQEGFVDRSFVSMDNLTSGSLPDLSPFDVTSYPYWNISHSVSTDSLLNGLTPKEYRRCSTPTNLNDSPPPLPPKRKIKQSLNCNGLCKPLSESRTSSTESFLNNSSIKYSTEEMSNSTFSKNCNKEMDAKQYKNGMDRINAIMDKMKNVNIDQDCPPKLPVKLRNRISNNSNESNICFACNDDRSGHLRPPSQYDNVSNSGWNEGNHSFSCPYQLANSKNLEEPPPLPPKKRNVMAYMHMVGSYSGPNDLALNLYLHPIHTYHFVNHFKSSQQQQQFELNLAQQSKNTETFIPSFAGSNDSMFSLESSDSSLLNQGCEKQIPPSLPPKRKHSAKLSQDIQIEALPRTSSPTSLVPSSESGISSQYDSTRSDCPEMTLGPLDEMDVTHYLVYKNPGDDGPDIRGGSIDVLIVKATEVSKNDFLFQEAFLTTYRTFISPADLVNKLLYRYNKLINYNDIGRRGAKNAFALLVRIVDDLCISDCNDKTIKTLLDFIYQLLLQGDLTLAKVLRSKVIEKYENRRNYLNSSPIPLPSINISTKTYNIHDFKSEAIAEQMTLLDASLFQKIEIAEVLLWAREQKEDLIPNLNKFTEHFNNMSYWARSRIVEIEDSKDREKCVLKFIKIMKYLRKLNNFNSYLALLSALDSGPIRRLDWQKGITECLKELCVLIDSSSSFRAYRQALAETQPPCIPYIGLILQDLTFVHIGNSDNLPDGNINFAKRWQIFNILDQMRRFRNSHYPLKKNEQILSYFNNFDNYLSEEAIWQISESIKPRGGAIKK